MIARTMDHERQGRGMRPRGILQVAGLAGAAAKPVESARFRRVAFRDAQPPALPRMFTRMRPNATRIADAALRMG